MEELKFLLNNFIVHREKDRELYYSIRDNYEEFREFIEKKLKYKMIIRPNFMKLEKLPGTPHISMGVRAFEKTLDYNIFLDILYFLDRRENGAQFLFTELKESIKLDWVKKSNWIALKRVLDFALEIPIIKSLDRIKGVDEEEEILLESLGNSRYIIVSDYIQNIKNEEELEAKVYRDLVMKSAVYSENIEVYEYCKRHREEIEYKLEKFLGWKLQIHKNFILPVVSENRIISNKFPSRSELSKIILQFNSLLRDKICNGILEKDREDRVEIQREDLENLLSELKEKNIENWTKLYREKKNSNIMEEMIKEMSFFDFIKIREDYIRFYPLCGKVVGEYGKK